MGNMAVLGAGGFIGGHLVGRLLEEGHSVRAVDVKGRDDWWQWHGSAQNHPGSDLRIYPECEASCEDMDYVYQLAADMGGAGFVFSGEHDAEIVRNSMLINLNVADSCRLADVSRILFSSSACVYPRFNQTDPDNPKCSEDSAYPADPDSDYGMEKLMAERLYAAYHRNYGLDVRIVRLHNVMGPHGSWTDGREKAPAACCRKIAEAEDGDVVEIWGDGLQTRSFMHVDDCLDGMLRMMASDYTKPVNLGREEMVSINDLFDMAADIGNKHVKFTHLLDKPQGVRGRNSDNDLIRKVLGWQPDTTLYDSMTELYQWVEEQVNHA